MSDFHSITPYGSKVCHRSMMGVTDCKFAVWGFYFEALDLCGFA